MKDALARGSQCRCKFHPPITRKPVPKCQGSDLQVYDQDGKNHTTLSIVIIMWTTSFQYYKIRLTERLMKRHLAFNIQINEDPVPCTV